VAEIDKLNSIINAVERDMVRLKKQYEQAVEERNYTGIQLIDRNDELCILYEKSNIQEQILRNGELQLNSRDEEVSHHPLLNPKPETRNPTDYPKP
jgi:hypothetical protein